MQTRDGWAWKAWEQLGRIRGPIIGRGNLQQRLTGAATELSLLSLDMLPENRRDTLGSIKDRLSSTVPRGDEGSYAASIATMTDEDREQIIADLLDLWCECEHAWKME